MLDKNIHRYIVVLFCGTYIMKLPYYHRSTTQILAIIIFSFSIMECSSSEIISSALGSVKNELNTKFSLQRFPSLGSETVISGYTLQLRGQSLYVGDGMWTSL